MTAGARPGSGKAVAAAIVGNLLEFFDFMSYAFFAVQIGHAFFPARTEFAQIMMSLVTFGVGFVTRPLGAAAFGWYADRAGRRAALSWTFGLMAAGTGLLAITPPFSAIGVAAPCLVVLARLIQGFASGGEVGPASVFLCEQSPPGRSAYLPSFQFGTQAIAMAMATGIGVLVSSMLSPAALEGWGWRLPFLLGIAVAPVGLYLRRQMVEEPRPVVGAPLPASGLASAPRPFIAIFFINAGETIRVYVQGYMVTFAILTLHLAPWKGMLATMLGAIVTAIVAPLAGALVPDRLRLRLVLVSEILSLATAYPGFVLVRDHPALWSLCVLTTGFSLVTAPRSGAGLSLMVDSLPSVARASGFGLAYSLAATLFGSTTQVVVTWCIRVTGDPLAPAWYLSGALLVATAAYLWLLPVRNVAPRISLAVAKSR
jgi:MFS family permease